jgi:eukaryotic-like serine/threonine-protein kinase
MREVQVSFPRGKVVRERYIVEELLGKGGFGAVYKVRDRRVRSNVFALKEVIDPNGYERDRLAFECEILKRLDHASLPRVYRVFEDERNNRFYMLMDYIEGSNLDKMRQRQLEKRFSVSQVLKIMAPIAEAITYLHAQQPPIIHRDIKPSNIIVSPACDGAVLVDFGIAKEYDQDSTTTAVRHCSPGYGAPEHYARGTNTRTDIYGLAATLYTLMTGKVPTDALYRMTQLGSKHNDPLVGANVLLPTIPQHIADVLEQAMAINSNDRYATIAEFWQTLTLYPIEEGEPEPLLVPVEDMHELAEALTPAVRTTSLGHETPRAPVERVRSRIPTAFAALILVALVAGGLFSSIAWPRSGLSSGSTSVDSTSLKNERSTAVARAAAPAKHAAAISKTETPPATPTAQPPTTTPVKSYPLLSASYSGTISDRYTSPPTNSSMSLSQIQQNGASISGYFAVGQGLIGSGDFSGNVNSANKIQFLIPGNYSLAPLFFEGQMKSDGSISGTYCSQLNGVCNKNAGGFGTWYVAASATGTRWNNSTRFYAASSSSATGVKRAYRSNIT